jgi:hypothetical protein
MTRPVALSVASGGRADRRVRGPHSNTANTAAGSAEAPKVYAGEVGVLPAPSRATKRRPRLVVPLDALSVPGRFPLSSIVSFNVPIRNDGTRPLRIQRLDPG